MLKYVVSSSQQLSLEGSVSSAVLSRTSSQPMKIENSNNRRNKDDDFVEQAKEFSPVTRSSSRRAKRASYKFSEVARSEMQFVDCFSNEQRSTTPNLTSRRPTSDQTTKQPALVFTIPAPHNPTDYSEYIESATEVTAVVRNVMRD